MNNNQFSPNAISHKDLNALLVKAKKEISLNESSKNHALIENEDFQDLIKNWKEASQEILLILNKKEQLITKNRNPKSLMAYGAMAAHINMAFQALKAAESDE